MIQRSTSDVDAIRRFFADQAVNAGRIIMLFVINFIAIWRLNAGLALFSAIVIPLVLGSLSRLFLIRAKGRAWLESVYLPFFHPVTTVALLATLVLIFAFQADNLTRHFVHVLLIAVPIQVQVYFNSGLVYGLMRLFKIPHNVAAPRALIGASNFFELAVAVAIMLFGADSGAALATVVGVLVEVPVMLSVCVFCNRTRHWFAAPAVASRATMS